MCVNGVVGFAGLGVTLATLEAGQATGAGQQGVAHRRRARSCGACAARRARRARAGRQRALRGAPVPARPAPGRPAAMGAPHRADGQSGGPFRGRSPGRAGRRHRRRRAGPPDLVDGPEDHDRLVDADEQGPRGDRGPRAVRRAATTRSRWWCTRSRSCTRWSSSPTARTIAQLSLPDMRLPIAYALAYPERHRHAVRPHRLGRARRGSTSSRPTSRPSRCLGLAYEAGRARRHGPRLAERRQRGRRGGLPRRPDPRGRHRRRTERGACTGMMGEPHDSVDAVIDADRRRPWRGPRGRSTRGSPRDRQPTPSDTGEPARMPVPPSATAWRDRRARRTLAPGPAGRADRRLRDARPACGWLIIVGALARDDLPARARPLPDRQVVGHEGHRVLPLLRPEASGRSGAARPSTASRPSRSAPTCASSG